jgi:D-alanyl-D-alanine carboxypeptidase (penicillin-binding protein 5/6)
MAVYRSSNGWSFTLYRLDFQLIMYKWLSCFLFLLSLCSTAWAQLAPPPLAAKSWIVLDVTSNQILASEAADTRVDPASLTKVMTAYLVFQQLKSGALRATDQVNVSEKAWKTGGSRMFIEPNRPVTVDELLRGMIVQSGNDATVALAEKVGGSEEGFVAAMNREAQRLGLKNSQFRNATGLSEPGHYSTARDMAVLAQRLILDFPDYLPLYSQREYTYNNIKQPNRNRLLWLDPAVDGLKTGHTEAAGFCLIATARRDLPAPVQGQRRLISVVMGTSSDNARAQESQKLLNWGFQQFEAVRALEANRAVDQVAVFKGEANELKAGVREDIFASVPRGQAADLKATIVRNERLLAPIRAGQQVGTIQLTVSGKPWREVALVALEDVNQAGVFGRAIDTIKLWFQ